MILLAALLALQDPVPSPDEGRVTAGRDRHSALRIELSGRLDAHYLLRDGALNEAGAALNGLAPERSSTSAWNGRASLRADIALEDAVAGVLELERRSFDDGRERPFASDPALDEIRLRQAYVEAGAFLSPDLLLRVGVQDLVFRNRPHDEPFFMALGESEGFHEGFSAAGGHVRNTVDRDVQEAAGIRLNWSPLEFAAIQGFWAVYREGGPSSHDESVAALYLNARTSESFAFWLMGAVVSGERVEGANLGRIGTVGVGADGYLWGKALELFGEAYLQGGTLLEGDRDIRRRAWAGTAGFRWYGAGLERLWLEGAAALRTGNRRAGDRTDEAFESYEDENRFLVMQSAEFGLDVDTNVRLARAAAGWSLEDPAVRFQIDVGGFRSDAPLRDASGARLTGERRWGVETDVSVRWAFNDSLLFWAQGAWLEDSKILRGLTRGREDGAGVLAAGADLRF